MKQQDLGEIVSFLKDKIEPLHDSARGLGYRASVYLVDGTFLPCVIFRSAGPIVDLAIRRFQEEQKGKGIFRKSDDKSYRRIVNSFITRGNRINEYDIARVEISKYAFPINIQKQIQGETTMGWTGFAARMKDGKHFGFGTTFLWEFFQMPEGYSVEDIEEIVNHSYVLKSGELRSHKEAFSTRPDDYKDAVVYRERPYFECFIEGL